MYIYYLVSVKKYPSFRQYLRFCHIPLRKEGVLMTKTHQQTKIQNKCSIFCSETIDFKMFIYYTIKQK